MVMPEVSFIVPVYNSAKFLADTLASLLAQTHRQIEVIIVDDGSTDQSVSIANQWAENDPRIRVFTTVHAGVSHARNTGIEHAKGAWITFIDSDDTVSPEYAARGLHLAAGEPVDLIIFSMRLIPIGSIDSGPENWLIPDDRFDSPRTYLAAMIERGEMLIYGPGNKLYRRILLHQKNLRFNESMTFGEDRLFNYHYLRHCGPIATQSHVVYHYFQRHNTSASASQSYRPDRLPLGLKLHHEKKALLQDFQFTDQALSHFLIADLSREIHDYIAALRQHWPHLTSPQKRTARQHLVEAKYPDYIHRVRPPTFAGRLLFWALRNHRSNLVSLALSLRR